VEVIKQGFCDLANRFVVILALFYIAGITAARLWLENPGNASLFIAGLFILTALFMVFSRIGLYKAVILLVASICGGIALTSAIQQPAGNLLEYAGLPAYIEGTVSEEPLFQEDHDAYILRVETVETAQGKHSVSGTVLVKQYGENEEKFRFGDRLRLRGAIVEPRGQRNPGGFDYRFYLKSRGIDALVYPRPGRIESIGRGEMNFLPAAAVSLRGRMVETIETALPSPSAELLAGILFGRGDRLPDQIEHNFQRAGAGHLLAVSGLHVGLIAAMITGLLIRLGLRGSFPLILAVILVLGYAYLTGMRPSALRAAVMVSLALGALILERERDLPTAVSLAALGTLMVNPLLLFGPGFQLSYAATLAIIYGRQPLEDLLARSGFPSFLHSPLAVILSAQMGVLPLSVYYFHHLPAGAVIFNLLLMPLTAFTIGLGLAGALLGLLFPFAGEILLWAARPPLELMLTIVGWSSMPGAYIPLSPPGITALVLYYGLPACFLLIYYRWKKEREYGGREVSLGRYMKENLAGPDPALFLRKPAFYSFLLLVTVVLIWKGIAFPPTSDLKVTFIDVGQGASALIEAPCGVVIMVDAGGELPFYGDPGEVGERVLLPLMRRERIDRIDLAVITHPHEDHFGGFIPLVGAVDIGLFMVSPVAGGSGYYEELLAKAEAADIPIVETRAGEVWSCGSCLVMDIHGPPERLLSGTGCDLNNNSVVIKLVFGEVRILFTGDIEDEAAADLFKRGLDLEAEVLQVPHHGGYMARMPEFLEEVRPELAVIQVGANPFGHPHPFVIEALENAGVQIFRNDRHGAVIIETDGYSVDVYTTEKPAATVQ